jgi:hypothetical protein
LTNAARRFYLYDGTMILDVEDLISWATKYYKDRALVLTKRKFCYLFIDKIIRLIILETPLLDKAELNTPLPPTSRLNLIVF